MFHSISILEKDFKKNLQKFKKRCYTCDVSAKNEKENCNISEH